MLKRVLVGAGLAVLVAVPGIAMADDAPTPAAAASVPCDPYKKFDCLDNYLGQGFWNRLVNYYTLEWGQPGAPADPNAPPGRRDGWPATPQTTPPMPFT